MVSPLKPLTGNVVDIRSHLQEESGRMRSAKYRYKNAGVTKRNLMQTNVMCAGMEMRMGMGMGMGICHCWCTTKQNVPPDCTYINDVGSKSGGRDIKKDRRGSTTLFLLLLGWRRSSAAVRYQGSVDVDCDTLIPRTILRRRTVTRDNGARSKRHGLVDARNGAHGNLGNIRKLAMSNRITLYMLAERRPAREGSGIYKSACSAMNRDGQGPR
jgi:hypothetical protein